MALRPHQNGHSPTAPLVSRCPRALRVPRVRAACRRWSRSPAAARPRAAGVWHRGMGTVARRGGFRAALAAASQSTPCWAGGGRSWAAEAGARYVRRGAQRALWWTASAEETPRRAADERHCSRVLGRALAGWRAPRSVTADSAPSFNTWSPARYAHKSRETPGSGRCGSNTFDCARLASTARAAPAGPVSRDETLRQPRPDRSRRRA